MNGIELLIYISSMSQFGDSISNILHVTSVKHYFWRKNIIAVKFIVS